MLKKLFTLCLFISIALASISQCATGLVYCQGICVNLVTNTNNCGQCGFQCGPGEVCVNGNCVPNTSAINNINGDQSKVFVFPNPVSNVVQVKISQLSDDKLTVTLYNVKGQVIERLSKGKIDYIKDIITINLPESIQTGIYFLSIESPEFNRVVKINKE